MKIFYTALGTPFSFSFPTGTAVILRHGVLLLKFFFLFVLSVDLIPPVIP